jgi:hypothetical protein
MSNLFGGGGKGGNTGTPEQVNIPPFLSSGGITPEQGDLAQFTLGQNLGAQGAQYGGEGLGASTMATQGAGGAQRTAAQDMGQMSDVNQGADYSLYQNDVSAEEQQLANSVQIEQQQELAGQQQDQNLLNLASQAGFGAGAQGQFGNTPT